MKKTRKRPAESDTLFDPDVCLTKLHQALRRDLNQATHEYGQNHSTTLKAFNDQVKYFDKKYKTMDSDQAKLEDETFSKFESVNSHMLDTNIKLILNLCNIGEGRIQRSSPTMEKIHKRARALMHSVLGSFDYSEWADECRHSSGSSVGVPFTDTSLEKKFTLPMTVTKRAEPILKSIISDNFQLSDAVEKFNGTTLTGEWYDIIDGSRATTVDKTNDKRRFICVEPTGNMYLQQGIMHMMYKRMQVVGLDVEQLPQRHVTEAMISSITGRNATIDWSSASDCVSIELLRWLLPPEWFDVVWSVRCDFTHIRGKKVPLQMISSMGNATTFPLETLVFWTYAHACRLTMNRYSNSLFPEWEDLMSCSVFGDDCIVPTEVASVFMEVMTELGFIVNDEKSFYGSEGFRESCGGDFLKGFNVRPFCIKAPQSTKLSSAESWLYIVGNALIKKYILYFGTLTYVYERAFLSTLASLFSEFNFKVKVVPDYYPDDSGLKIGEDLFRFQENYDFDFDRISVSKDGTYRFRYKRFVYNKKYRQDDHLRYVDWLQSHNQHDVVERHLIVSRFIGFNQLTGQLETLPMNNVRRVGGYVVAKGLSVHWTVRDRRPRGLPA